MLLGRILRLDQEAPLLRQRGKVGRSWTFST